MNKSLCLTFIMLILMNVGCSTQSTEKNRLKVLILSGMNNHGWQETTVALESLYRDSGHFNVVTIQSPSMLTEEMLSEFDVVVSNWTNYPSEQRVWGDQAENALIDFVRNGKGFVVVHAACVCFHDWQDFQKIVGATWKEDITDHGDPHTFQVMIEDNHHPITEGLEPFRIHDELWHRMEVQPGTHILCRAYSDPEQGGTGHNEPLVFTTSFGKGRGFNLVLGHDTNAMANPSWKHLMLRGTEWAATDKVTIKP
ncbi:MAG: ThuA domain-containing protein [Planctomycetota bacterium]